MLVAIVSDTHISGRVRRRLPADCIERLRGADLIVHAGDLTTMPVLEELRGYAELVAVRGNRDDAAVRAALPEQAALDLAGRRVLVIHDGGRRVGRLSRLRRKFPGADAVIFGHSHIPAHGTDAGGFQIFNPGSPTDRRQAPRHTMGLARASRDGVRFELVALD
jgi:hypothetical protein